MVTAMPASAAVALALESRGALSQKVPERRCLEAAAEPSRAAAEAGLGIALFLAGPGAPPSCSEKEALPPAPGLGRSLPAAQNQYKIRNLAEAPVAIPGLLVV